MLSCTCMGGSSCSSCRSMRRWYAVSPHSLPSDTGRSAVLYPISESTDQHRPSTVSLHGTRAIKACLSHTSALSSWLHKRKKIPLQIFPIFSQKRASSGKLYLLQPYALEVTIMVRIQRSYAILIERKVPCFITSTGYN